MEQVEPGTGRHPRPTGRWGRLLLRSTIFLLAPAVSWCQLHLLAGTPLANGDEQSGAVLLKLSQGRIQRVSELVSPRIGLFWASVSYDLGKAVFIVGDDSLMVFDLNQAAIVKRCLEHDEENVGALRRWLVDVPGKGGLLESAISGPDVSASYVRAMDLNPAIPCEQSFFRVPRSDIRYLSAHGNAGVGDVRTFEGWPGAFMDENGNLRHSTLHTDAPFGLQVPKDFWRGISSGIVAILVNTAAMAVVGFGQDLESLAPPRVAVFRKRDKVWRLIPVESYGRYPSRAFGHYLAITEARPRRNIDGSPVNGSPVKDSAGRAEWRRWSSTLGPNIEAVLDGADSAYTGKLYLYNIDTEQLFSISTKQGDSEILLVENETVYYRISHRLYSAPITSKGIAPLSS